MNPNLNAFLSSLRALLLVIGGLLAEHGLEHTTYYSDVMIAAGAVMVVGPAIWGVWSALVNWHKAAAIGSQATLNMVAAGKAIAADGTTLTAVGTGTTPPKAVTIATAAEIVKDFAPATPPAKV